jgi:proteasome assembly chaperone 2
MFVSSTNRKHDWQNSTLILPTVSVGNVGQLTADLIISTLCMEQVGFVLHPCLLPVVGNNPYADDDSSSYKMTTSCEVFESVAAKLVVVQQRTPIVKGRRKEYSDWLSNWAKENKFRQVVVLTSTFAQDRLDHQITGSPFRILLSPRMEEESGEYFKTELKWQKLEPRNTADLPGSSTHLHMPGSGIAKLVYENCQELPVLVLMMFVYEGDNAQDALAAADQLNRWLNLLSHENVQAKQPQNGSLVGKNLDWKVPISWKLMFGSRYDRKLYQ